MKKVIEYFQGFFEPAPDDDVIYEPVHVAMVLLVACAALGILYWLLWALLVCEGGIFSKVGPALQVAFTSKTLADFGYHGYPYALGAFEGWIVNLAALVLLLALIAALYYLYQSKNK